MTKELNSVMIKWSNASMPRIPLEPLAPRESPPSPLTPHPFPSTQSTPPSTGRSEDVDLTSGSVAGSSGCRLLTISQGLYLD
jgi:hypothetical protein